MKVCEIFTSIQGESSYVGMPCTFIRLSGCNLDCRHCDTQYAKSEGMEMSEKDILNEVSLVGVHLVCITGGEPLLQDDVFHLIETLLNDGSEVLVETNGSQSIKDIDPRATVVLDIKSPGSGMFEEMDLMNIEFLKEKDEVKLVLSSRDDYEWAISFVEKYDITSKCKLLLSPTFGQMDPEELSKWIIEDRVPARLNIQAHKYIFGADCRAR